jgi:hypothetical protein
MRSSARLAQRTDANLREAEGMPGTGLTEATRGKALSDMPAFQPYWGKPAVRNDRGSDGNVGIIRSPVRAIAPPDLGMTGLMLRWLPQIAMSSYARLVCP